MNELGRKLNKTLLSCLLLAVASTAVAGTLPIGPVAPVGSELPYAETANFGPSAGSTSFEFITKGHMYRIRQTGDVKRFSVLIGTTTSLSGIQLKVWRLSGGVYNLVGESEVFTAYSTNTVNTYSLATPFEATAGDYVGARLTYTSSNGGDLRISAAYEADTIGLVPETVVVYSTSNVASAASGFSWESANSSESYAIRLAVYMDSPDVVFYGDSITSGLFNTYSFADDAAPIYCATCSYPTQVAATEGVSYQTIARTGRLSSDLNSEFFSYVAPVFPKYVVVNVGINDVNVGVALATIVSNVTAILDKIVYVGAIPVVIGILPEAPHAGVDYVRYRKIDDFNAAIQPVVESAPYNGFFVDSTSMGEFFDGGDPGNLWKLKTAYRSVPDSVHLSPAGQTALASIVSNAVVFVPRSSSGFVGSATGGTVTTEGEYTIHTFSSNGTFQVTGDLSVEYLVVGGGGGGGGYFGGGGGAGGVRHGFVDLAEGSYSVVVGTGGLKGDGASGQAGMLSSFSTIVSSGGGKGSYAEVGGNGGSGGGGGTSGVPGWAGGIATPIGQGNNGGSGGLGTQGYPSGGGGGAWTAGKNSSVNKGGDGGAPLSFNISGTAVNYGGGGGGGVRTGTKGSGGLRSGGDSGAGDSGSNPGAPGVAGTGGGGGSGGGAGAGDEQDGGDGASGVVIVRYFSGTFPEPPSAESQGSFGFWGKFRWRGWR